MGKRLMTLSDLYNYYSTQGKNQVFSCGESNETIVVQVDGRMNFSKDNSMDGLYPTRVQLNFIGDNLNGSRIKLNAQENALSSSKFRPLLAYIHEVDGEPQFYGHNMHQDEDGNLVYDEQPVGVIAEEAHIEHDDEYDMDYAVANGYIWEEYSRAAEIIERDGKCDVSVELAIRELSYDAKDKILNLDNFYYSGCSILGVDDDGNKVNPAMPGSNITLSDFSMNVENDTFLENLKLIETLEKLNTTLSNFNNTKTDNSVEDNLEEGGNQEMFEKLLEQYGKTVEDITFEYENLTDEELEVAFSEAFAEDDTNEDGAEPEAPASEEEPEGNDDESTEGVDDTEDEPEVKDEFSITINGETKTFSLSLNDKLNALYSLVNETYSEQDNDWYDTVVYEDEKLVEMHAFWSGKHFRQSYKKKGDTFSLTGDRTEIFARFMTQDEINAFENMKANYSSISDKLAKYESEPEKMEIINSEDYSQISETDEFKAFAEQDAHFDMSVDDVKSYMDEMLLEFAKKGNLNFAVTQTNKEVGMKQIPMSGNKKESRYGDLFSNNK